MYLDLQVPVYSIKESTVFNLNFPDNLKPFPVMCIDTDSYIVGAKLESGLDFNVTGGVHNLQIGKYSSLAEDILFLVDVDHDYHHVCTGALSVFQGRKFTRKLKRKGQIIIQNDCWIGNGVTIMGGVTVHNGAVIAAKSVVTKDVPPYAIVGGNPARVIKYRFDEQQIQHLQRIAWWNWSQDKIRQNAELLYGNVSEFVAAHIEAANRKLSNVTPLNFAKSNGVNLTHLFIPDFYEPYPVYERVIDEFARKYKGKKEEMLVYIGQNNQTEENKAKIYNIIRKYAEDNHFIHTHVEKVEDERSLFKIADYYITTRAKENIQRMCLSDLYNVKCISGVDIPVFESEKIIENKSNV